MGPSPARARQLRLSAGSQLTEEGLEEILDWLFTGPGAARATSLSARTNFFAALVLAGFDLADGGGAEFSLSGLATAEPLRSRQASFADDSGHALAFESAAGSFPGSPCGTANSIAGSICDAAVGAPNCRPRGADGVFGRPVFGAGAETIAATLSI